MGAFSAIYAGLTVLYFCSWIIALCGLSALQEDCDEKKAVYVEWGQFSGYLFATSSTTYTECDKLFRFPWYVVWHGFFPMLFLTRHFRKAGILLYATAIPLFCLLANQLNIIQDLPKVHGSTETNAQVALAGFAMCAAFALCLVAFGAVAESMEDEKDLEKKITQKYSTTGFV